jgi:hypothetical protein
MTLPYLVPVFVDGDAEAQWWAARAAKRDADIRLVAVTWLTVATLTVSGVLAWLAGRMFA